MSPHPRQSILLRGQGSPEPCGQGLAAARKKPGDSWVHEMAVKGTDGDKSPTEHRQGLPQQWAAGRAARASGEHPALGSSRERPSLWRRTPKSHGQGRQCWASLEVWRSLSALLLQVLLLHLKQGTKLVCEPLLCVYAEVFQWKCSDPEKLEYSFFLNAFVGK